MALEPELVLSLVNEVPDACVVLTPQGQIRYWSGGAQAVFGHEAEAALGQSMAELVVPPEQQPEWQRLLAETIATGQATGEAVRSHCDGSLLYVDVTTRLLRRPDSEPLIIVVEKDVTRLRVLRDAKQMETRFRELLESTPDGIVMVGATGHIVIANSEAERLFGYGAGELRGLLVETLLPQRYRHGHVGHRSGYFLQPRKRAMGSGLDLAGLRKNGTEFPVEISLSPLRTEESVFVMSAIRDISERKRFERALQEKNVELANANAAKDRFLASMSHELRTPLNAIIGFTGTLLMKLPGPLNPDQERQLRTVQTSARHLLALINDLLDVARIEAGKVALHLESVDCAAALEEVVATLQPQAAAKSLALRLHLPGGVPTLVTDRRLLCQIVINLVGNAIKFTETGHVEVTLRALASAQGGGLQVEVADSGVGIAPEDQPKLFGAFSRVSTSRPRNPEGTGLGLHLSLKLAELLGGRIEFVSEVGCGSTFTLTLPQR